MGTKICSNPNCIHNGIPQSLDNFQIHKLGKDGKNPRCKDCRKLEGKDYRKNNIEVLKIKEAKRRKEQKPALQLAQKKHYIKNNENIKIWHKKYRNSLATETYIIKLEQYEECRQDPNNLELLQVRCLYCNSWFNPTKEEVKRRLQSIIGTTHGENRFYCSDGCKDACPIFGQVLKPKGFNSKASSKEVNPEFRKMIFERDNYTCQKCGLHKDDLEVPLHCHHIIPKSIDSLQECDIDNGITLCKLCHFKLHKDLDGCGVAELRDSCKNKI